jgi:hypothetical protein
VAASIAVTVPGIRLVQDSLEILGMEEIGRVTERPPTSNVSSIRVVRKRAESRRTCSPEVSRLSTASRHAGLFTAIRR